MHTLVLIIINHRILLVLNLHTGLENNTETTCTCTVLRYTELFVESHKFIVSHVYLVPQMELTPIRISSICLALEN